MSETNARPDGFVVLHRSVLAGMARAGLSPGACFLWMTIATFTSGRRADRHGWAVTYEELAEITGYKERQLRRLVNELCGVSVGEGEPAADPWLIARPVFYTDKRGERKQGANKWRAVVPPSAGVPVGEIPAGAMGVRSDQDRGGSDLTGIEGGQERPPGGGQERPPLRGVRNDPHRSTEDIQFGSTPLPPNTDTGRDEEQAVREWADRYVETHTTRIEPCNEDEAIRAFNALSTEEQNTRLSEAEEVARACHPDETAAEIGHLAWDSCIAELAADPANGRRVRDLAAVRAFVEGDPRAVEAAVQDAAARGVVARRTGRSRVHVAQELARAARGISTAG